MRRKKWGRVALIVVGVLLGGYFIFLLGNQIYTQHMIETDVAPNTYQTIKKYVVIKNRQAWLKEHRDIAGKHSGVDNLDLLNGIVSSANQHSDIMTADESDQTMTKGVPTVKKVNGYTWVDMPTDLVDLGSSTSRQYIKVTNQAILGAKHGIVFDLRDHNGGEPTTMILSMAPLLKNGRVFSAMDNKDKVHPYYLRTDTLSGGITDTINKGHVKSVTKEKKSGLKIAIIVNDMTASAAEITSIALKSNYPNVKLIGQPTAGDTSVNSEVSYDYLTFSTDFTYTVGWIVDNQGHVYKNEPLKPDYLAKSQRQINQAVTKALQ